MQEHAVQRAEIGTDIVQQAVFDIIKGVAGNHTARKTIGVDRGHHLNVGIRKYGAQVHLRNGILTKPQVIIFQICFIGDICIGFGHKLCYQNFFTHRRFSLPKEAQAHVDARRRSGDRHQCAWLYDEVDKVIVCC